MVATFFTSWALWQKMTFVLACAIALTLCGSYVKLYYDRRRLRQYTEIAAASLEAQVESAAATQPMQEAIPFGIRALEQGIEVEGIWISRTNTPVTSVRGSTAGSLIEEADRLLASARPGSIRDIDPSRFGLPPRGIHHLSANSIHNRATSKGSTDTNNRTVSFGALPDTLTTDPSPSTPKASSSSALMASPSSPISDNSIVPDGDTTRMMLEARNGQRRTILKRNDFSFDSEQSSSSPIEAVQDDRNSLQPPAPARRKSRAPQPTEQFLKRLDSARSASLSHARKASLTLAPELALKVKDVDLELLMTHRLSHVAETGQLAPRKRKYLAPGDGKSMTPDGKRFLDANDYFVPRNSISQPSSPQQSAHRLSLVATPRTTGNSSSELHPLPLPLLSGVFQSPQASADLRNVASSGAIQTTVTNASHNSGKEAVSSAATYSTPTLAQNTHASRIAAPKASQGVTEASFEMKRNSQVLRRINSGFEILVPGSLSTPEVALEPESIPSRETRKLQKKRPGSASSITSISRIETVS